jgi:hypothetical protein
MGTRFASSLFAGACLAATWGSAHAEGLNLRHLPHGALVGYEFNPSLDTAGGLVEGRTGADEAVQANPHDSCESGLSHCLVMPKWSVLGPADTADARTAIAEKEAHARLPAATGMQSDLSPQVALRAPYQQYLRENALEVKPAMGALAMGVRFAL